MNRAPTKMSRHFFLFILTWTTLFVFGLILVVGPHVSSLGTFYWFTSFGTETGYSSDITHNNNNNNNSSVTQLLLHHHGLTLSGSNHNTDSSDNTGRLTNSSMSGSLAMQVNSVSGISQTVPVPSVHSRRKFQCKEESPSNIVFLKVHKSGSTTVANMLARYALQHNLNVALPNRPPGKPRFNYFRAGHFDEGSDVIPRPQNEHYHVLFNHMIYNYSALHRLMPERTFYCGIMREPFSRFISSINYYPFMLPPNLKQYLLFGPKALRGRTGTKKGSSSSYYRPTLQRVDLKKLLIAVGTERRIVERRCEVFNALACNTGLSSTFYRNYTAVVQHTQKLAAELDLMMVMEHFHESLVLLKRRACLSLKDIVYIRLNSARTNSARKLTQDDERTLKAWQGADHYIYDFFYRRFLQEVRQEGETFWQEVEVFKKVLDMTQSFCDGVPSAPAQDDVLKVPASVWNEEFTLNGKDCDLMHLKELAMQRRLISRAWRKAAEAESAEPVHDPKP